jgi:hypothetical protein
MFCPVCKAEYREGFTRCSDCEVELVPTLESSETSEEEEGPVLVWRGDDLLAFSRVVAILRAEKIKYFQIADHEQLAFQAATPRPGYEIFVRKRDLLRAETIVQEAFKTEPAE